MRNETDGSAVLAWEYIGEDPYLVCTECGAVVHPPYVGVHQRWHREMWAEA